MPMSKEAASVRYPVVEVFGPTVQGEGPHAGRVVSFVRFGGCDYRCSWCDSLYAVLPQEVKQNSTKMTAAEIVSALPPKSDTVILSGGNPALIHGDQLVRALADAGKAFHVETQGSRWRTWLRHAELLVVSPKPPSSGMAEKAEQEVPKFIHRWQAEGQNPLVLKFVVADQQDLTWALDVYDAVNPRGDLPLYLSALTPPDCSLEQLAASYRNLCELVLGSHRARKAEPVVLPQLHVIAWGHERGV
jgi:7-carboxy-7-deazaguanine synthase